MKIDLGPLEAIDVLTALREAIAYEKQFLHISAYAPIKIDAYTKLINKIDEARANDVLGR
jgi:hypothetical protein